MSSSGIINWTGNGKIFDSLLPNPYPYPAQANDLAQVLIAGQDAGNQDIINLNQLEVTNIVQQAAIGGHLSVGTPGGDLRIEGCTTLGSMLAGDGTSSKELPLGTNGYVLTADSTQAVGVKWAAAGGAGVASITAGSNIGVNNAIPAAPVVSLLSPLTSTLNAGTQNIQGTSTQITLTNGGSQANVQANLGFTSVVSATPTTKANLFNQSISVETLANKVIIQPTSIIKSVGATAFTIGTIGSAPINMMGAAGQANGISLTQVQNVGTTLTTSIADVKFYPDTYISNNNAISIGVPIPQVIYQRLTLNNLGLTNTSLWSDYGGGVYGGYSAFFRDSNGNILLAQAGTGNIQVYDNPPNTLLHSITMTGTLTGGVPQVNVFYEQGGYVFIGGNFTTINGNATAQYGIARVNINASYIEDPMFDSLNNESGIINGEVYDMTDDAGELLIVGSFTQTNTGNTALHMLNISSPYVAGGGVQNFIEAYGGADNPVYSVVYVSSVGKIYFGGNFLNVGINLFPSSTFAAHVAYWDIVGASWVQPNTFNQSVSKISFSINASYLLVVGGFTNFTQPYSVYLDVNTDGTQDTNLTLQTPPNYQQVFSGFPGGQAAVFDPAAVSFLVEVSNQSWTPLGDPAGSGSLAGILNFSGDWKVIYGGSGFIRSHQTLPHSCVFTGSFVYDAVPYTAYTISTRNVSQQFIGDANCSFWSIIGQGVGVFS